MRVHRSCVVNLSSIAQVTRNLNETADIHPKNRLEVLLVSRTYRHPFGQSIAVDAQQFATLTVEPQT